MTEAMYHEIEEQLERDLEIVGKIKSPVIEINEKPEEELQRMNFKLIKRGVNNE